MKQKEKTLKKNRVIHAVTKLVEENQLKKRTIKNIKTESQCKKNINLIPNNFKVATNRRANKPQKNLKKLITRCTVKMSVLSVF